MNKKELKVRNYKLWEGFSLIEMVIYVAILAFVVVFVVFSISYVGRSYQILKAERSLATSAVVSLDRMTREIKDSELIDLGGSTFDSHPGELTVQPESVRFFVESQDLQIQEGAASPASLLTGDVRLTNLVFKKIDSTNSQAVKIEMTLEVTVGEIIKSEDFYTTAVLRGSY